MSDQVIVSGAFRTTTNPKSVLYTSQNFVKRLEYSTVDGMALFEGDIILSTEEEAERARVRETLKELGMLPLETMKLPKALVDALVSFGKQAALEAVVIPDHRWPDRTIPFVIDPGLTNPERVTTAIAHWESRTPIRFRARKNDDENWVRFVAGAGCSSAVGCRGGEQKVILGSDCTSGNAIHEIGHTVGLWHEQSREDRDNFIEVDLSNVIDGTAHNFRQHISDGDDIGGYDFGSVMHYPLNAFAIDPDKPTLKPKVAPPPNVQIGQRIALSEGDVAAVIKMYS